MKSFGQYLLEYSLGPNHPDFGKPNFGIPKDPPPPPGDDEIKATISNKNEMQIAHSYHPSGVVVKSAKFTDGTYMFGLSYGETLFHEVVMKDGQVQHLRKINPDTGEHYITESDTDKVESLLVRHLGAHVYDSDLKPTGRTVGEHHTSPEG